MIGTATLTDGPTLTAPVKILAWRTASFGERCATVETLPGGKGGWGVAGKRLIVNARLLSDIVEIDDSEQPPATPIPAAEIPVADQDKYAEARAAAEPREDDGEVKAAQRKQLAAVVERIDGINRWLEESWKDRPGCVNTRTKQHAVRYDAALSRTARAFKELGHLETSARVLMLRLNQTEPTPVTPETLANARFVRDNSGMWHEVVRVNRVTVKVVVAPGWNDLIKINRIVEVR